MTRNNAGVLNQDGTNVGQFDDADLDGFLGNDGIQYLPQEELDQILDDGLDSLSQEMAAEQAAYEQQGLKLAHSNFNSAKAHSNDPYEDLVGIDWEALWEAQSRQEAEQEVALEGLLDQIDREVTLIETAPTLEHQKAKLDVRRQFTDVAHFQIDVTKTKIHVKYLYKVATDGYCHKLVLESGDFICEGLQDPEEKGNFVFTAGDKLQALPGISSALTNEILSDHRIVEKLIFGTENTCRMSRNGRETLSFSLPRRKKFSQARKICKEQIRRRQSRNRQFERLTA